ncbi:hypothetical protein BJ944DRAFT_288851 [Cunninghamella echinulata]|nr:hypothetical protein BJ944DRAFT_288851 [Cunninghamella echinulata]
MEIGVLSCRIDNRVPYLNYISEKKMIKYRTDTYPLNIYAINDILGAANYPVIASTEDLSVQNFINNLENLSPVNDLEKLSVEYLNVAKNRTDVTCIPTNQPYKKIRKYCGVNGCEHFYYNSSELTVHQQVYHYGGYKCDYTNCGKTFKSLRLDLTKTYEEPK